ncbi:MAG: TatD family hydrolase [Alistipes sp.]|nr:TatD family hydrolase [Alistipes sp.]
MNLIDTHSHIYDEAFDDDRDAVVARAAEAGVTTLMLPDIDSSSRDRMFDLARKYPGMCLPMLGLHPTSVNDNPHWRDEIDQVERLLHEPPAERIYGIGETGLDLYWSSDFLAEQSEAMRAQIELAIEGDLPVVIHTRSAWDQMISLISDYKSRSLRGIFHAFAADVATYRRLRDCGDFVFGIGGVATFKNSRMEPVLQEIPLEQMVLETDAPYLTPVPFRGRRNESAYVTYICQKVAEVKGISPDEVAERTTATARRIFRLG